MATRGGQIFHPLAIGVDRGHPQWLDLYIYFFAEKVTGEGSGWWCLLARGGRWAAIGGGVWVYLVG